VIPVKLLLDKQTSGESVYSKEINNQNGTMRHLSCIFLWLFMIPRSWSEKRV